MADNSTLPATGEAIASDDISSVKYQRIKLIFGADGVNSGDVAFDNPLPTSNMFNVAVEFTRPSDTTPYTAGDMWSDSTSTTTMQAIANAARATGLGGYIVGARISTDKKSITPRVRVHMFNTTGATLSADNAAYKELYADSSKRVGFFDMPAMTTAADATNSDMSRSIDMNLRLPYTCAATSLYFVFEPLDAFTPASAQKATLTLYLDRM